MLRRKIKCKDCGEKVLLIVDDGQSTILDLYDDEGNMVDGIEDGNEHDCDGGY